MTIAQASCDVLQGKAVERSEISGRMMVLKRECRRIGLSKR